MHNNDLILLFVMLFLIMSVYGTAVIGTFKVPLLHFTVVMVAFGLLMGGAVRIMYPSTEWSNETFDDELFFRAVLPVIIFAAGYSLDTRTFFQNATPISLMGVGCTVATWLFLAVCVSLFKELGWARSDLSSTEGFILGAVLSSTDTVAVVTLMHPQAAPTLYCVLAGEGVANDGVSVVLFRTVTNLAQTDKDGTLSASQLVVEFLRVFFLSIILGAACGLGSAITAKYTRTRPPQEVEVTLLLLWGFTSYFLAETVDCSGIISLFVCGMVMSSYSNTSLSPEARGVALNSLTAMSYAMQALVYTLLGFYSWMYLGKDFVFTGIDGAREDALLALGLFAALAVLRAVVASVFLTLSNCLRSGSSTRLAPREVGAIWFGGLIRGVLAFALSLGIEQDYAPRRDGLVTTTYIIVISTVVMGGVLAKPVFSLLGVPLTPQEEAELLVEDGTEGNYGSGERGKRSVDVHEEARASGVVLRFLRTFDSRVMRPFFASASDTARVHELAPLSTTSDV